MNLRSKLNSGRTSRLPLPSSPGKLPAMFLNSLPPDTLPPTQPASCVLFHLRCSPHKPVTVQGEFGTPGWWQSEHSVCPPPNEFSCACPTDGKWGCTQDQSPGFRTPSFPSLPIFEHSGQSQPPWQAGGPRLDPELQTAPGEHIDPWSARIEGGWAVSPTHTPPPTQHLFLRAGGDWLSPAPLPRPRFQGGLVSAFQSVGQGPKNQLLLWGAPGTTQGFFCPSLPSGAQLVPVPALGRTKMQHCLGFSQDAEKHFSLLSPNNCTGGLQRLLRTCWHLAAPKERPLPVHFPKWLFPPFLFSRGPLRALRPELQLSQVLTSEPLFSTGAELSNTPLRMCRGHCCLSTHRLMERARCSPQALLQTSMCENPKAKHNLLLAVFSV